MAIDKKYFLFVFSLIIILIILFLALNKGDRAEEQTTQIKKISPIELAENKEKYEGKTVEILNAYIPSEAFIYIIKDSGEERIFIKPPNRTYCRYFNLKGELQRDIEAQRWIFLVNESECLKKT